MQQAEYVGAFNKSLIRLFAGAIKLGFKNPSYFIFLIKNLFRQRNKSRIRQSLAKKGINVPPFMIASITRKCNLKCAGCYAKALENTHSQELSTERLNGIIREADNLGVSTILLAGGEPLTRKDILQISANYPSIIFPLFTNGLLIDNDAVSILKQNKNIVPIISIEGKKQATDTRRGKGVFIKAASAMQKLKKAGVVFGVSFTVTKENFDNLTNMEFLKEIYERGAGIFFFVEYIPAQEGSEYLVINQSEREKIPELMQQFRSKIPALFIAFPGEEEKFGGCLSAGRGFVHISAEGNLEPCPFAPYSDTSLVNLSLEDALKSEFLRKIRSHPEHLSETKNGCALFENRAFVQSLLR
jgi:MoaA/NifB/PqqE/SkfB family radical SAM enzyme